MRNTKFISLALVLAVMASMLCGFSMTASAAVTELYVATTGSDAGDGSISAPFATLQAARDAARKIDGDVIINIRGGKYRMDSALVLGKEDSNTTYRAYPGEKVTFNAATELDIDAFEPISEEAKAYIIDQKNAGKVKMIDLKAQGITEYGSLMKIGYTIGKEIGYSPSLFVNDKEQTYARYPNEGYVETGAVLRVGAPRTTEGFTFQVDAATKARMKKWTHAKEPWVFGYFIHDWCDAYYPVASFDASKGTLTTGWNDLYGVVEQRRYYYYNLLEELDAPGEWYLDRETGILYLYPEENMKTVEFVTCGDPFFEVENAENILIKNIKFEKNTGPGVKGTDVVNLVVDGCEFFGISDTAVYFLQSEENNGKTKNCGLKNSYIHDVGAGGVRIEAGDRINLIPGNCFATNNHFERYSNIKTVYAAGVTLIGVGHKADHNEFNDAPHFAIEYRGNDMIIEYNEAYRVCTNTADSGAFYGGYDWTYRGSEVRYNYFHDMEMIATKTGMKVQAVYVDDMQCGTRVHGNIFYKVSSIALFGGGRYNTFTNNLMLESDEPFRYDSRGTKWMDSGENSGHMKRLLAMPYNTGAWAERYPELANILNDDPGVPKHNVIKNNVIYKTPAMEIDPNVSTYGTVENNITIGNTKSFKDYKNGDFTLVEGGEILKKIPDFEIIDYSKIGRYEVGEEETPAVSADTIQLTIGSDKLYKGEEVVTLDVPAQIKNGRTLVPLRAIFEALGATVLWDDATKTVTSTKGDITISLAIGSDQLYKNGEAITLDVPAQVVDDRTLVPVRAISESFGCEVGWDDATKTVTIDVK